MPGKTSPYHALASQVLAELTVQLITRKALLGKGWGELGIHDAAVSRLRRGKAGLGVLMETAAAVGYTVEVRLVRAEGGQR